VSRVTLFLNCSEIVKCAKTGELPNITMKAARAEAEMVLFSAVQQALDKTGIKIS
jgi:hypothetical protein